MTTSPGHPNRRGTRRLLALALAVPTWAGAQTVDQTTHSLAWLTKTACIEDRGGRPFFVSAVPSSVPKPIWCRADAECTLPATCRHASEVLGPDLLAPQLELRPVPTVPGRGEGVLRYAPLCEDGSGDHEYSTSDGVLGQAPTCAPADFIRCADGGRPLYRIAPGAPTGNDWLVHAGGGGHFSSPNTSEAIWALAHTQDAGAYLSTEDPALKFDLTGIFDSDPTNPFSAFHRVWIDKCTPDKWLGNRSHRLADYLTTETFEMVVGACEDADGNGTANCDDNLVDPEACVCQVLALDPPVSPGNEYDVHYHGKRIVRAVLADLADGAVARVAYPLIDDGSGGVEVQSGDVALPVPNADSRVVFTCHSSGCSGLMGGHLDDLHAAIDAIVGADVDVRAISSGGAPTSYEAEALVTEVEDLDLDLVPDSEAWIDDAATMYDHVVDAVCMTGQDMGTRFLEPGGSRVVLLDDWYDGTRPGYAPPVDVSCLATHCPTAPDWRLDPGCGPCADHVHVNLNHLSTPFLINQGQTDSVLSKGGPYCLDAPNGAEESCDFRGELSGLDIVDSHWRHATRKQLADLFRFAATDRCEAATEGAGVYDEVVIVSPDWSHHGPLSEIDVATKRLDPQGPVPDTSLAEWAWAFVNGSGGSPLHAICLQERVSGENAADFSGGGIPTCQ